MGSYCGERCKHGAGASGQGRPRVEQLDEIGVSRSNVRKRRPKTLLRIVVKPEVALVYVILVSVL